MSLNLKQEEGDDESSLINYNAVKMAAIIIRALNNPVRKRIIDLLLKNETVNVSNMVYNLREEQTVISQHLNVLRQAKIVTFLKKGKNVYYFLNKSRVQEIQTCLSTLFEENAGEN